MVRRFFVLSSFVAIFLDTLVCLVLCFACGVGKSPPSIRRVLSTMRGCKAGGGGGTVRFHVTHNTQFNGG